MKKSVVYHWLPPEAISFLKENVLYEKRQIKDDLGNFVKIDLPVKKCIGKYGAFHSQELSQYSLKDGSTAKEFIQRQVDGKDYNFFIGLYHRDKSYIWPLEKLESVK